MSLSAGTEGRDGEDDSHQRAQASWVARMVTSFFSDSSLFNTREGRAGKVHNFMLGLNLNTSMPFSPFSDYMSLPCEEEVDAVTGEHSKVKYSTSLMMERTYCYILLYGANTKAILCLSFLLVILCGNALCLCSLIPF